MRYVQVDSANMSRSGFEIGRGLHISSRYGGLPGCCLAFVLECRFFVTRELTYMFFLSWNAQTGVSSDRSCETFCTTK